MGNNKGDISRLLFHFHPYHSILRHVLSIGYGMDFAADADGLPSTTSTALSQNNNAAH